MKRYPWLILAAAVALASCGGTATPSTTSTTGKCALENDAESSVQI
jgi:hypothetical protein